MTIPHVNVGKAVPGIYQAQLAADKAAKEAAEQTGLDPLLVQLVLIRASQLNGCAYCLRMHTRDALAAGETTDRLAVVAAWWESQYFSPAEQAALVITEHVTRIGDAHFSPAPEIDVAAALDEHQVAAVIALAISINTWNRIAIMSHYPVKP